jgi:hypothetical protein
MIRVSFNFIFENKKRLSIMSNYLYFLYEQQILTDRFNLERPREGYEVNGLYDWQRLISFLLEFLSGERDQINERSQIIRTGIYHELAELSGTGNFNIYNQENLMADGRSVQELIVTLLLFRLRKSYRTLPANKCPRLFISHRRDDKDYALRIAELAAQNGFAYWVDVLDPDLQSLTNSRIPERLFPLITACIIEMALINCTHVIACLTPNSRGTLWIPYEYGRITELPGLSVNACAWLNPNLLSVDFPEYMLLGEITKNEREIETWLQSEWRICGKNSCKPDGVDIPVFGGINKLPEESNDDLETKKQKFENWLSEGLPLLNDLKNISMPLKLKTRERPA